MGIGLLTGCQTWDLPTRKTQRQCTTPGGQFVPTFNLLEATFTISQPTGTTSRIDWNFGDNKTQSTTSFSAKHIYAQKGTYMVSATMTNLCEQTTTLSRTITISDITPPTVTIQDATDITKSTATLRMTIANTGKGTINEYGVCYSKTNSLPTVADLKTGFGINLPNGGAAYSVSGLEPRVTYYMRAYARNETNQAPAEPNYSQEVKTFKVFYDPILSLAGTPVITGTNATVGFRVTDQGNPTVLQYGIVYSATNSMPEVGNSLSVGLNNPITGLDITLNLSNLMLDKTYTYRPFARASDGTITYGPTGMFSTVDIATDLIVNVPFTNQSLVDQSGNNNNAYTIGNPSFSTDRKGVANSAIQLNGNGQYFYFIDGASLRPAELSISLWIRASVINGRTQLYNKSRFNDSFGEQYSSLIQPSGTSSGLTINTDIKQGSNCTPAKGWQTFSVTSALPIVNVWRHIVFTYEGRTARMYLDGTLLSERPDLPFSMMDNCAGGDLKFGAQIKDFPQYFNGTIDDIRVYRRSLTAAQVKALTDL